MGYRGAKLASIFPDAPAARASRRMAAAGGSFLTERAAAHSPVDTGDLKQSWKKKPVVELADARLVLGEKMYGSGTETDVAYAPYVEYGTGLWGPKHAKYPIRPKDPNGFLHFFWAKLNRDVWFKMVMHPGAKGQGMLAQAFTDAIEAWPRYLLGELERFNTEMVAIMEAEAARSRAEVRR